MNMNAIDLKGSEFAGMRGAYAAFAKPALWYHVTHDWV